MKLKKRDPNDPAVLERILARIDAMSPEELIEMLNRRPEGLDETNMNETLKQYDCEQREKAVQAKVR